jgi:type II secretory ATPase GspE/PulE/Tfp pilus assembly ATPase PilB-like protein
VKTLIKNADEIVARAGLVSAEDLERARSEARQRQTSFEQALVELRLAPESDVMRVLSEHIGVPYAPLRDRRIAAEAVEKIPARVAFHYNACPLEWNGTSLIVAMSDPTALQQVDDLRLFLHHDIEPVLSGPLEIRETLQRLYGVGAETLEQLTPTKPTAVGANAAVDDLRGLTEEASVVKFVNQMLLEAFESRATDLHLEPFHKELQVRRRIDGVLYNTPVPPSIHQFQDAIISRIKVMANLDIGERRLPQDGRIKVRISGSDLDLRVSILPTPFGESVTIRLLTSDLYVDFEQIGFFEKDIPYLKSLIEKPHGIILLTGPTGSGKTTTLYSFLSRLNDEHTKIITVEDPIEYQLRGVTQIQVQPKIGLDFARTLRSMLRHDPDVMMVGEIRDLETAEIAIRVALTGHLVFSTLHTNDAAGSITRLLDMGLEPFLVSSSLESVIAQRLVRVICPKCRKEGPVMEGKKSFIGAGCEQCRFTGYRGRTGIYEILKMTREVRTMIMRSASADEIRQHALEQGMVTLRQCGAAKIEAGITTPEEVLRVTMKEDE